MLPSQQLKLKIPEKCVYITLGLNIFLEYIKEENLENCVRKFK